MTKSLEFTDRTKYRAFYRAFLISPDSETEKYLGCSPIQLYAEANLRAIKTFGKDSLSYKNLTHGIDFENLTGSQFFWNTWLNTCGVLPKGKSVAVLNDAENFLSRDQNFVSGFYTDFPQLILRSGIDPYPKNQPLLDDLVRKLKGTRVHGGAYEYSPENPLLITGAELKNSKSKTKYGIILNINDAVIKNDERFAYEKYLIKLGNIQRSLLTKEDGVAGMYLSRGALYSNYCDFTFSIPAGRVIVIDAKGV